LSTSYHLGFWVKLSEGTVTLRILDPNFHIYTIVVEALIVEKILTISLIVSVIAAVTLFIRKKLP
jgi:hypothetical protein